MSENKIEIARAMMVQKQPFFASILLGTPFIEDKNIPTAATDGLKLWYNNEWLSSLETDEIVGVLAHEICHMIYEHSARRGARHPLLFNVAADLAINPIIKECGLTLPAGHLDDKKYHGMNAEQIYELLEKDAKEAAQKQKQLSDSGMDSDIKEPTGGRGEGDDDGDGNGASSPLTDLERQEAASEIRARVAKAAQLAKLAGKMPAGLQRMVDELLNPKVPWQEVLRDYMVSSVKRDETWDRRNRRFSKIYLPSRWTQAMGKIVFIDDTSGSISDDDIRQYNAEHYACCEDVNPESIHVVYCDAAIAGEQEFGQGEFDPALLEPKGGGGTDMRVALEYVEDLEPDVVILLTDGYTPWPDCEPPFPLIVCCTTDAECPVGKVIRLND